MAVPPPGPRRAEVLAALSLAIDLGLGRRAGRGGIQPLEPYSGSKLRA